jgi:hypothetical protein
MLVFVLLISFVGEKPRGCQLATLTGKASKNCWPPKLADSADRDIQLEAREHKP